MNNCRTAAGRSCWQATLLSLILATVCSSLPVAGADGASAEPNNNVAAPIPDTIETVAGTSTNAARVAALARWQDVPGADATNWVLILPTDSCAFFGWIIRDQ